VTVLEARRVQAVVFIRCASLSRRAVCRSGAARIPDNHDLTLKYVKEFALPLEPFYPQR
jgi:monoamine oxidase